MKTVSLRAGLQEDESLLHSLCYQQHGRSTLSHGPWVHGPKLLHFDSLCNRKLLHTKVPHIALYAKLRCSIVRLALLSRNDSGVQVRQHLQAAPCRDVRLVWNHKSPQDGLDCLLGASILAPGPDVPGPGSPLLESSRVLEHALVGKEVLNAELLRSAADHIRRGEADLMLAGGADAAVIPSGMGGFIACKALSKRNEDPASASRPWDKQRDGFVMGEGAGQPT